MYRNSVNAPLRAIEQIAIDSCQQPEVLFLSKEQTLFKKGCSCISRSLLAIVVKMTEKMGCKPQFSRASVGHIEMKLGEGKVVGLPAIQEFPDFRTGSFNSHTQSRYGKLTNV
jgi:hypothetical protein